MSYNTTKNIYRSNISVEKSLLYNETFVKFKKNIS